MFIFRKARRPAQTLNDLDAYISGLGDEPVKWLAREVQSWGEFSYTELENLIADGRLEDLLDWQERYASVVNDIFNPMWLRAMEFAAQKATRNLITISDSDSDVKDWLKTHGGELITRLSSESRRAVSAVIMYFQATNDFTYKQIARAVRPLIGLTQRQALANARYRQKIFERTGNANLADKAATRYASKQHRFRAETITNTELAFAYNRGADVGIKRAISLGLMNRCEMIWSTAGTNRVCPRCMALKDKVIGYTDEETQIPPLHPRCRCVIRYREVTTDALAAPYPTGRGYRSPTNFPRTASECKSFDDLKTYWAENYNVKVSDEIATLHFESVREACRGIERVLNEFPPAGRYLKELALNDADGLMTTSRFAGKINFNPAYFTDKVKITAEIHAGVVSGFYPKNMTVFGAGAHEMTHIVEDWLIDKSDLPKVADLRIMPKRIVLEAYVQIIKTFGTAEEVRTLNQLRAEISRHARRYNFSECLADAAVDYLTNGQMAALLSKGIWKRLKETLNYMTAFSESKLAKYTDKEFEEYGIFDDLGTIIGVKDDAPADFKQAYEEYKEHCQKMEDLGLD